MLIIPSQHAKREYSNGLEDDYSEIYRHQVKLRQEENSCFAENFIVRLKEVWGVGACMYV